MPGIVHCPVAKLYVPPEYPATLPTPLAARAASTGSCKVCSTTRMPANHPLPQTSGVQTMTPPVTWPVVGFTIAQPACSLGAIPGA